MSKVSSRDQAAFARLDELYARLPTITCRRLCGIACGSLPITDLEARRLQLATHRKPKTIPIIVDGRQQEQCIYLQGGSVCKAYDVRPLLCRVWGIVKMLSCHHGCLPERWVSTNEFYDLAIEVERLAGGRVLRTTPDGLAHEPGESFQAIQAHSVAAGESRRSQAALDADAERTRNLRAIFGGRIIAAVDNTQT